MTVTPVYHAGGCPDDSRQSRLNLRDRNPAAPMTTLKIDDRETKQPDQSKGDEVTSKETTESKKSTQ